MISSETFDITVESPAYGGEALGRHTDGRVVFVPFAIPGERVRVRVVEDKSKYVRAELVEVLDPSAHRVTPRCQHFGTCGGCHYQHMDYPSQLKAKASILKEQLERIGGIRAFPDIEIRPSPEPWNYRNTVQFHITPEGKLGYQKAHSNQTFAIHECHLPDPSINELWPIIDVEPEAGIARLSLRAGWQGDMMILLESRSDQPVEFGIEEVPVSVVQQGPGGKIVLAGSDYIKMEISGRQFQVSAGSFFQVNSSQAEAMVGFLLEHLPLAADQQIVDAYCGVGLFSAFLAGKVNKLVGIEISPEACEDFATNLDEFDHVDLYEDSVEQVFNSIELHPDVILMDPPRAGLGSRTIEGMLKQGARHLAYVSCDPATLARDAKQMSAEGYSLVQLALFDMFPQTYHIESISVWEK